MFRGPNDLASHLFPINTVIQLFIDQSYNGNIIASHEVETMADLGAGFWVVCWSNDAFDGVVQDDIRDLVAGKQCPN
jgi:hypothetical protein